MTTMKSLWQRFINQRTVLIVLVMLFIAFLLQLRHGGIGDGRELPVYEQHGLVVDQDCDIAQRACASSTEGVRVTLALLDKPGALQAFPVKVTIEGLAAPQDAKVSLVFSMQGMDMGDLGHKLNMESASATWFGKVILPICTTGRSDWIAQLEVLDGTRLYRADYSFMLQK